MQIPSGWAFGEDNFSRVLILQCNLSCVCVGVDHDELVKLAEKHFSGLRSTYEAQDKVEPCRFTGSEVCAIGCPGFGYFLTHH